MTGRPEPWLGKGRAWRLGLALLSRLYALGHACLRLWHRGGPARARVPVLSVGNLSVGGTGKSLVVRALAQRAARRGRKPAILLRGYGAAKGPRPLSVGPKDGALLAGDEAVEHARALGCPVWVDANRLRSAEAATKAGALCLVLDDGFQRRWQLARDLDLLLADYSEVMAGEALLPAGPFREPWREVDHCDLVLLSGAPAGLDAEALKKALPLPWRAKPLFRLDRVPKGLASWPGKAPAPLSCLKGKEVLALSGLGRPQGFEQTLESLGARPLPWRFQDHHRFTGRELASPPQEAGLIVTTAKDAVRLPLDWVPSAPVYVLRVEADVRPAQAFWRRVDAALPHSAPERLP